MAATASQNLLTRLSGAMIDRFYKAAHWQDESVYHAAKRAASVDGAKIAMRDAGLALSYADLIALADGVAQDLTAAGLRPGDRVAAWLSSRAETAVFLLACSRQGFVFCPSLHRNHTVEEVGQLLARMNAKAFIAEIGYGADAQTHDIFEIAGQLPQMRKVYRLAPTAARDVATIAAGLSVTTAKNTVAGHADDIVYLAFTSGTTGEPKGVMHSNNTLLANARALAQDWQFNPQSVIYTLSPLSHNLGFGALVLSMSVGAEIVVHDLPRGASLLAKLRATRSTFVFGVPAHAIDLLDELDSSGQADLVDLKGFRISGAAAPAGVVERLLAHGVVPQSGYGMTEAGSHHYTLPTDKPETIIATSGRACPGYEVKIFSVDDPDLEMPVGQVGQIGGQGASLMLGYFDDQQATENAFNRDDWFMTGDLGRLDERGYLQITGRIKEIIIRGGHNIHPARIELLTTRHPQVERAAAIPVKDERLGEKVCLVVMPKNGSDIDPYALLSHLQHEGLSKYDMPEYFLQVTEIPLSASGKILKRALMPAIAEGSLTPQPIRWQG